MGDDAFKSFFKTACMHQAKESMREEDSPDYIPLYDVFTDESEDAQEIYSDIQTVEYQRKLDMYGIDLKSVEDQEDRLPMVVKAFHSLSEKCKFLILLRYFVNLSHHDIVETLYNFYEIKNEDVSKAELSRCLKYIRIKIENQKPFIQN
jgi:DNA-directed RNA polymerase specialized sigma subunit